jgi:hypothetical protein
MTRHNASARAVPLLKSAIQRLPDGEKKESATFTLFEAYLDTNDWKAAEDVWPAARRRLTPGELPEWLGRTAVAAA